VAVGCLALANCASKPKSSSGLGVSASPRVIPMGQPVPKGGGRRITGKPYVVGGKTYRPSDDPSGYSAVGTASWYGMDFRGRLTSNGEIFDLDALSAAHPTLPVPSYMRVTNLENGRSVVVRVNDRGPYHGNRLIDVSRMTAEVLGFRRKGTTKVRVTYVAPAPLRGSDDRMLLATYRENGRPAPPPREVQFADLPKPLPPARDGSVDPLVAMATGRTAPHPDSYERRVASAGEGVRHSAPAPMLAAASVPLPVPSPIRMGSERRLAMAVPARPAMEPVYYHEPVAKAAPAPIARPAGHWNGHSPGSLAGLY
jgi:rare lipoprotein A